MLDVKATVMSVPRGGRDLENFPLQTSHLKESPFRNAVEVTPSLEMLLSSLLMLSKATAASHLSSEVPTAVKVCCCFCRIIVPWCLFSAESSGAISLLQSDEVHPSSSLSSWPHLLMTTPVLVWMCFGAPLSTLIFNTFLMLVRLFYFFKVGSCSCKLYLLNWFFCSGKIRSIKSHG